MDAKDLRTEAVLGERTSDGTNKYSHLGTSLPCSVNKNYSEIPSNPLAKLDTPTSRPCAVIGPDRVLPPPTNTDAYLKKSHYEPWPPTESTFRHPPEYPHKIYQSPVRNISPRQTFQENMQRIMVAPTYNSMKMNEETNFGLDRNTSLVKNKLSGSAEPKYCDVPYTINHLSENPKNPEMCVSNVNSVRNCPPIWHPSGVNMRPARPYAPSELYQFPEYASCAVPRPMTIARPPHRTVSDESSHPYSEGYYHHGNVRFKPYPNIKERYAPARYEYVNNYPNPFHPPPPFPPHKYDLHKSVPSHPSYHQVPMKYLENRMNNSVIDAYQKPTQQINYNAPYQNQMLHPVYGSVLPNSLQSKLYAYPQDKTVAANKLPYENNNKMYLEIENSRNKGYPDNFYANDVSRNHIKSQVIIPNNYPSMNLPPHPYYRKDGHSSKGYDYMPHFRNVDPNTIQHLTRMAPQFSPSGIAMSPSDSNTSNDTALTHGNPLEDCGYVSQSSTASVRSIESGIHRILPNDIHRRYNYGYPSMVRASPLANKVQSNINHSITSKDKKGIDVRQFLQMWNEGDEENAGNSKEIQNDFRQDSNKSLTQIEAKTQDQLYVLGLVNVPSEELGKYEHIQKVSKLPENIKGYNNIELLKHFEEAIESSNLNNVNKISSPRNYLPQRNSYPAGVAIPARPISPLDVEAKISQSVIHKEVGCNFEIRPCSPEMLNVEVATPVQNILKERVIEKVSNPYQSPAINNLPNNGKNCNVPNQDVIMLNETAKIPSCKLNNTQCLNSDVNVIRTDYNLDLESNSGVCLASLPRLDNDIELNFPEVNQQFINDNKDSVISPKDSQKPTEVDTSNFNNDENHSDQSYKIHVKETEKEFSKLSKYRKNKKEAEPKETTPIMNSQLLRTDSVIIKNPENAKYYEDPPDNSLNATNLEREPNYDSNLSSTIIMQTPTQNFHVNDNILPKDPNNDMAIDFSLHKSKPNFDSKISIADDDKSSWGDNVSIDKNIQSIENTNYTKTLSTSQTCTDNHDSLLTESNKSSKSSLVYIGENPSDKILGQDVTEQSAHYVAKDTVKSAEDRMITDDEDVKSTAIETKEKENNNDSTNTLCSELDIDDKINEGTNRSSDFILVDSEIQNVSYQSHKVSAKHVNEQTKDSYDNILEKENSQKLDKTGHLGNNEDSANESNNVTFDFKSVSANHSAVFKSCDLKKKLFSPWIQKLLLKSDDSILKRNPIKENVVESSEGYSDSSKIDDSSNRAKDNEASNDSLNFTNALDTMESSKVSDKCNSIANEDICTIEEVLEIDANVNEIPSIQNEIPTILNSETCYKNKNDPVNISERNDEIQPAKNPNYSPKADQMDQNNKVDEDICTIEEIQETDANVIEILSIQNEIPIITNCKTCCENKNDKNDDPVNISEQNDEIQPANNPNFRPQAYQIDQNNEVDEDVCSIKEIQESNADVNEVPSIKNEKDAISSREMCVDNKDILQKISEQNDEIPSANNSKNRLKAWDKNNKDKNSNILYFNEQKVQTPSPNISNAISIVDFNNDIKEITNITKPCRQVEPLNMARENLNECFANLNKNLDSSEHIEICNPDNIKEFTPTEDSVNSCFPVQGKGESQAVFKIASNKMCAEENQTKLELNEQSSFKLTLTEDTNEFGSQSEASESKQDMETSQVQETMKPASIDKDVFNNSENLKSPNKTETKSYKTKHVLENEHSNIFKEVVEDNEGNHTETEKEMEGSRGSINFVKAHNNYENNDNKIEENVNFDNNLSESKTKTEVKESENINEDIYTDSEDFEKEKRDSVNCTETTKIIQIAGTMSNEQKTNELPKLIESIYTPNIIESESNIFTDDCIKINKEEYVHSKNSEIMDSLQISNDETMIGTSNFDSEFFIINERNHTDKYFITSSSKPVVAEDDTHVQKTQSNSLVLSDDQHPSQELEEICFIHNSNDEIQLECQNHLKNRRHTLKRSLSDSAIDTINTNQSEEFGNETSMWSKRRRKNNEYFKICDTNIDTDNVCNFQNNRRNSISSVYNEENLSFCIVIDDDCIITQDNEDKICFAEVAEDCFPGAQESDFIQTDNETPTEMLLCSQTDTGEISEPFVLEISDENAFHNSWVEDIGCVETVVSDDVAEDVTISAPSSPQNQNVLETDHSDVFIDSYGHTDKVKHIYGGLLCNDDAELLETLYRTPQMNVNKTLLNRESHSDDYEEFDEYNFAKKYGETQLDHSISDLKNPPNSLDNRCALYINSIEDSPNNAHDLVTACEDLVPTELDKCSSDVVKTQDETVNSCESSIDNVFLYNQGNDALNFETQSSPEVSSTTSEEKCSSILLKITNYKGTRTSQLNEINIENTSNCCKFTENISYTSLNNSSKPRPLITKGAQKYIPPIIELADDLKVKLPLPQQSLLKLKQLKIAKTMPKQSSSKINETCKKPKPRFEDVLKSIDEIQFKMHKEKSKRPKKPVPKVVIKKSENGSHYASMPNKVYFNPDLTGRKWQPWVFIEKDNFIDKMAIKNKTKAIFSHRKNTYVLADKFQKYKSASSAKFIISQPKLDDQSGGQLKYTIRLKHTY